MSSFLYFALQSGLPYAGICTSQLLPNGVRIGLEIVHYADLKLQICKFGRKVASLERDDGGYRLIGKALGEHFTTDMAGNTSEGDFYVEFGEQWP